MNKGHRRVGKLRDRPTTRAPAGFGLIDRASSTSRRLAAAGADAAGVAPVLRPRGAEWGGATTSSKSTSSCAKRRGEASAATTAAAAAVAAGAAAAFTLSLPICGEGGRGGRAASSSSNSRGGEGAAAAGALDQNSNSDVVAARHHPDITPLKTQTEDAHCSPPCTRLVEKAASPKART